MTIEEMKRIAALRTPGKRYATDAEVWSGPEYKLDLGPYGYTVSLNPDESGWETDNGYSSYTIRQADAEFYAMAANNWDKLMAIVESADRAQKTYLAYADLFDLELDEALKALESE